MNVKFIEDAQFNVELTKEEFVGKFNEEQNDLIAVEVVQEKRFPVDFSANTFNVDLSDIQPANQYTGDYEVTPRLYLQTLATNGKSMRNDVTVYEIPVVSTTNPHGGQTILIG